MKRLLLNSLAIYRRWMSPAVHAIFPGGCRFHPTCSEYAMEAIIIHGSWSGGLLALRRLSRCHPFGSSGFDPVPLPKPQVTHSAMGKPATLHDPLP